MRCVTVPLLIPSSLHLASPVPHSSGWQFVSRLPAAEFFAAPDGQTGGDGSYGHPWDLDASPVGYPVSLTPTSPEFNVFVLLSNLGPALDNRLYLPVLTR
jgi:hypothetical protein